MPVSNPSPFTEFREECARLLRTALEKVCGSIPDGVELKLSVPGDPALGELSFSTFVLAKRIGTDPRELAARIAEAAGGHESGLVDRIEPAGAGYVNFYIDIESFAERLASAVRLQGSGFGASRGDGERVIVEHTSVNPIHPIHIGGARNAVVGDCISRLLGAV
ncbi:MAG: hypothetical protein QFX35_07330, partial [Candidatus Verstraetearchaeota archaeon]|nr:hypothetical protein [Candidatus Verstraetearchaeota archaeon]